MNDGFIGPGVAEFFPDKAFDGFGVVAQRLDLRLQLLGFFLFGLQLRIQSVDFRAHPFVFVNERQVAHANEQHHGQDDQAGDEVRQFAPDAEINVHAAS